MYHLNKCGNLGRHGRRIRHQIRTWFGANIKVFDRQLYRLQRLQYAVGSRIFTSIIDSLNLSNAIKEADVVIGALRSEIGRAPVVITEEMVSQMKPNSLIIDVAIDQGGCCETSEMTKPR